MRTGGFVGLIAVFTVGLAFAGLVFGPVHLEATQIWAFISGNADPAATAILGQIRAPRVLFGAAVGAGLALSGIALQGILRNPLADPGLIGVTAGAALGAVSVIVLGNLFVETLPEGARPYILPAAAFIGAATVTAFVFSLSRRAGTTSVATLILAGVAINAIGGAAIGALIYISDDQQLRDLTFWSMGGLGQADWTAGILAMVCIVAAAIGLIQMSRALDLFQLGERAAFHAGIDTERIKLQAAGWSALAVGAGTAVAGPIGFIGLVAPHLARLCVGPAHRIAAPVAALLGAALILAADLAVRTAIPPAEPPIGLATSLIGGPFFLWLLIRHLRQETPHA